MIDLTRGITRSTLMWRTGGSPQTAISSQLSSRTLGIIGYGNIGRHLAMLARAMGMRVLVNDPYVQVDPEAGVEQVSFDDLLTTADIVVPLVVATPATSEPHRRRGAGKDETQRISDQRFAWGSGR